MSDTQETIWLIKKTAILERDEKGKPIKLIGLALDVKARYTHALATADVKKANANPKRAYHYTFKRLKLS